MRRRKGNTGGAPAWMTTFADLMALMLTFFVLMLSLAKIDARRYEDALESIKDAFGKPWHGRLTGSATPIGERGAVPLEVVTIKPLPVPPPTPPEESEEVHEKHEQPDPLYNAIRESMAQDVNESHIELERWHGKIIVRFPEHISFPTGSADLNGDFLPILDRLATTLQGSERNIVVVGHTDNRPINTARYRSNWDLSAARAASVVHHLLQRAPFAAQQIIAQGRADAMPLLPNDSPEHQARNRRVELVISEGQ